MPEPDDERDEDGIPKGVHVNYGIHGGNGNGGTAKILWWFLGGVLTLYVAMTGAYIVWTGTSIVELKTDVAVIKCQVSKQCQGVQK